ncbi:hypothetical protein MOK15_07165 [Sphingobium sp. BYY-5]|uniref:hypothetical protein n=1 Tax=Sphingobium sp. BYY-5 TaxID=2926400 RepID=UPI001FA6C926|nr:hypothetical protein [Sphingobium sp. BYY-5]MCI4589869.1 hypothetical protein [Sphingobium sp. BYY-5]
MAERMRGALVAQRQKTGGAVRTQLRKPRKDGWSKTQVAEFMAVLAETCNVSEAARAVGKCRARAYDRRRSDPAFASAWNAALDQGYVEIEMMLMRAALYGSESEETVLDSEGAVKTRKVKRAPNLTVALRLWQHYRDKVAKIRGETGVDRPDSADAVARVRDVLDEIRRRRAAAGT